MSEVLIDDLNLNKIANSIRRKNGLVRTYKPREMAPAIQAFRNFIPSTHEFTVTINQSPHQLITAKRYLLTGRTNHTRTFTVSEPFYMMELSIVPDGGYEEGTLNYESPVIIDRDMVISATPAIPISESPDWVRLYVNGDRGRNAFESYDYMKLYWDEDLTQDNNLNQLPSCKLMLIGTNNNISSLNRLLGGTWATASHGTLVYRVYLSIDSSNVADFERCFLGCHNLQTVNVESLDTRNATSFIQMFSFCNSLTTINVSNFDTTYVTSMQSMFQGCTSLFSVDMSQWETPRLRVAENMFTDCTGIVSLDISGWDTTNIESLTFPPNVKYIIMDEDRDIKFKGSFIPLNPNNYVKYLVPSTMVNAYKAHANWSSRASQIVSVDDYSIIRYAGEVEVNKNDDD